MQLSSFVRRAAGAAVLACLIAPIARADDAKPNPEYEAWAKCKPGATVTIKGSTETAGNKMENSVTTKLLEVTPEKAVVESTITMEMMGQKMPQPPQKRDVPKTFVMPKPHAVPGQPEQKAPEPKIGEETITVAGKEYKCKTTEIELNQNGMKVHSKTWTSDQVPGGMVKMTSDATGAVSAKTTMELVEYKDGN
ncbi:MAG: hypothetical protein QM754_02565 [Tepidisphaeraceae bacterium]